MRLQADSLALGIDLGTGSVKVVVIDPEGRTVARSSAKYELVAPRPGWAETDPATWWDAVVTAVHAATRDQAARVCSIGLSGQMHGVVMVDATGRDLRNAILWADQRADPMLDMFRELPRDLRRKIANPLSPGMAGPILTWLRDHEPNVYAAAGAALQPKDWLRLRLTGTTGTDPSDASATLLFDVGGDAWAFDVAAAIGVRPELLPPISPSDSIAGVLTTETAGQLGLEPGLPVSVGAADTAAALLGTGIQNAHTAQISIGSAAQIVVPLDEPIADANRGTYLFRSALARGWYAMAAMQNAGVALERVRQWLSVSWDEAYSLARSSPPGANEVTFVPYLTGERTPLFDPHLRGGWVNLSLSTNRADLMRAALEGVAFGIRLGLDALRTAGHRIDTAILTGGGAVHDEWQQIVTEILGIRMMPSPVSDASGRGAAILGAKVAGWPCDHMLCAEGWGSRVFEPTPDSSQYSAAYGRFIAAVPNPRTDRP